MIYNRAKNLKLSDYIVDNLSDEEVYLFYLRVEIEVGFQILSLPVILEVEEKNKRKFAGSLICKLVGIYDHKICRFDRYEIPYRKLLEKNFFINKKTIIIPSTSVEKIIVGKIPSLK
jgi:hypothetical protein